MEKIRGKVGVVVRRLRGRRGRIRLVASAANQPGVVIVRVPCYGYIVDRIRCCKRTEVGRCVLFVSVGI